MGLADVTRNTNGIRVAVRIIRDRYLALALVGCNSYPIVDDWLLLANQMRLKKDAMITRLFCFIVYIACFQVNELNNSCFLPVKTYT
jgi:hypothetical protein